ncbi:hypothetical protein ACFSHT_34480 [Paraburkholderia silviterrae]|uniref:Uncharacterized protein n=1 Tax=Paraburkholderia silviterrae TaxID=2528715 RepID=A0A4R5M710_9BURK|nr:hypothetical protein [Paraburkholderia silviterrae]TDG21508.1 hypothetical protein EYW47_21810 [Paraburkholderia silviterrae]
MTASLAHPSRKRSPLQIHPDALVEKIREATYQRAVKKHFLTSLSEYLLPQTLTFAICEPGWPVPGRFSTLAACLAPTPPKTLTFGGRPPESDPEFPHL